MVQQVAELVEDGLHFAMREERRPAAHRGGEVSANQAQVRLESAG